MKKTAQSKTKKLYEPISIRTRRRILLTAALKTEDMRKSTQCFKAIEDLQRLLLKAIDRPQRLLPYTINVISSSAYDSETTEVRFNLEKAYFVFNYADPRISRKSYLDNVVKMHKMLYAMRGKVIREYVVYDFINHVRLKI